MSFFVRLNIRENARGEKRNVEATRHDDAWVVVKMGIRIYNFITDFTQLLQILAIVK